MIYVFIFLLGLIVGSFLNVCIYRLPRELSIVYPSSRCPSCGTPIRFYDNIPIVSYLLLGGRCRYCKSRVAIRYPLVEMINGAFYVVILFIFRNEPLYVSAVYFIYISCLIIIFFVDIDFQIIPDSITLPGIPVGIILGSLLLPDPFYRDSLLGLKGSLTGAVAGGGGFFLIAVVGKAVLKKDAMGGGDIKMMAMVGALMGWKGVIMTTFIGSLAGSVVGVLLIMFKGREWGSKIPFGPYLAAGSVVSLFWGENLLNLWLRYLHAG